MANTYVDYTATAGQTDFAFSFPFLEDSHVVVEVEGVNQALTTNYTIETSPAQKIVLSNPTTALAGGELVRVKRVSDPSTDLVDFENGSVLTETELDRAYRHNRYLAEEAYDGVNAGLGELEGSTNYNAGNKQIKNLADGTLATDAVNKGYVDTQIALTDTNLAGFYKSTHTGNAVDNVFTLSFTPQTTEAEAYIVSIDGLVQVPDTDYTIGATDITFNTIPANSAEICVVATAASSVATVNEAQVTATGSTNARSLANRFADVVNVLDYGVKNDGTDHITGDNNATRIQAAIDSGASVYIPKGTYIISSPITIEGVEGQSVTGEGPTLTHIISSGTSAFYIPGAGRFPGISNMAIQCTSVGGIAIALGTRGGVGGAGATFAQGVQLNNLRIVSSAYGIYAYGSNYGNFNTIIYENCTVGLVFQPVDIGNTNGNDLRQNTFYNCGTTFRWETNLDGGNDSLENTFSGGLEATTGATLFYIRGYANSFDLYIDVNGSAVPDIDNTDANYYIFRDAQNTNISYDNNSEIVRFIGGQLEHSLSFFAKPSKNVFQFSAGGSINQSDVRGSGDNATLVVQNTAGSILELRLNVLGDVPVGFELVLVVASNTDGFNIRVPVSGGPWTTIGWNDNDYLLAFVTAGTAIRFVKINETTIARVI